MTEILCASQWTEYTQRIEYNHSTDYAINSMSTWIYIKDQTSDLRTKSPIYYSLIIEGESPDQGPVSQSLKSALPVAFLPLTFLDTKYVGFSRTALSVSLGPDVGGRG